MAVALVTYRYTDRDAAEFWHAVAMDDRLAMNDPRKKLHFHIYTTKLRGYEPHVYSRYVARAWNAAWENKKLQSLQAQNITAPIHLEGTPHDGEKVLRYITPRGDVLHDPEVYRPDAWQQELFMA